MRPIRTLLAAMVITVMGLTLLAGCGKSAPPPQEATPEQKEQIEKMRKQKND